MYTKESHLYTITTSRFVLNKVDRAALTVSMVHHDSRLGEGTSIIFVAVLAMMALMVG